MPRALQTTDRESATAHLFPSQFALENGHRPANSQPVSRVTALSIEFVAKPNETHRVQTALPSALHGSFGEVTGFAGGFVLIANYEARLVTVVTLWSGADRMQRCNESLKWIRALLNPYLDRCLRIQTLAAFVPERKAPGEAVYPGGDSEGIEDGAMASCAA